MTTFRNIPAGIRLDAAWPERVSQLADPPEIAELRAEFRARIPKVAMHLETLDQMRKIRQLIGSLAGPRQVTLTIGPSSSVG
jgi:hypothetical protein